MLRYLGTWTLYQALQGRNTFDLRFVSDVARQKGVTSLTGIDGLTVTPYERSVWATRLQVGLEVRQELVASVLGRPTGLSRRARFVRTLRHRVRTERALPVLG